MRSEHTHRKKKKKKEIRKKKKKRVTFVGCIEGLDEGERRRRKKNVIKVLRTNRRNAQVKSEEEGITHTQERKRKRTGGKFGSTLPDLFLGCCATAKEGNQKMSQWKKKKKEGKRENAE